VCHASRKGPFVRTEKADQTSGGGQIKVLELPGGGRLESRQMKKKKSQGVKKTRRTEARSIKKCGKRAEEKSQGRRRKSFREKERQARGTEAPDWGFAKKTGHREVGRKR